MQTRDALQLLLVTNNPEDVQVVERASCKWACLEYEHVLTLTEAIDRIAVDRFDVVLLDLRLPDGSGMETLKRFHRAKPLIPILVLTDSNESESGWEALRQGALLHLVRGEFSAHMLAQSIRYAVVRTRGEDHARRLSSVAAHTADAA